MASTLLSWPRFTVITWAQPSYQESAVREQASLQRSSGLLLLLRSKNPSSCHTLLFEHSLSLSINVCLKYPLRPMSLENSFHVWFIDASYTQGLSLLCTSWIMHERLQEEKAREKKSIFQGHRTENSHQQHHAVYKETHLFFLTQSCWFRPLDPIFLTNMYMSKVHLNQKF